MLDSGQGGAIYFLVTLTSYSTRLYIDSSSIIQNCSAQFKGGAIVWNREEPFLIYNGEDIRLHNFNQIETFKDIFNGNTAEIYGNDIASPPSMIKLL